MPRDLSFFEVRRDAHWNVDSVAKTAPPVGVLFSLKNIIADGAVIAGPRPGPVPHRKPRLF
jgi:hypothetical protein